MGRLLYRNFCAAVLRFDVHSKIILASQAAASGGVTTVCDMPLNAIPPTTTVENLEQKKEAAKGKCFVDVAFWGGIIGHEGNAVKLTLFVQYMTALTRKHLLNE